MSRTILFAAVASAVLAGAARADVVVGVAGPLSGTFAPVGQEIRAGVEGAADALNRRGGIGGERIVVETLDDKCDPQAGAAVANQLVGRGASVVVGHACTAAALPAARVYQENGIVFVSPAATNPRLTDENVGPGVFRLAPRSDGQARAVAEYLAAAFQGKRVAFVHDGSVYGQGFVEAARKGFEALGNKAVVTQSFTPGEKSQNNLVGLLQDAAPDAVVIGALQADAAVVASEMRERGLSAVIVGDEAVGLEEFRDLAGGASEGVVFALPIDDRTRPEAADAVAALRAAGVEPSGATLASYAALEVYAAAVEKAGDRAFQAVAAAMSSGSFDTVVGPVAFDEKGDRAGTGWTLYVWRVGQPVPLR